MAQAYGENERLSKLLKPAPSSPPRQESFRDYTREQYARLKAQDQGINPTGDEGLPFTWGPLLASLTKFGVNTARRQLLKRRLMKDPAGKPQPFYHGTSEKFKGDIKPTRVFESLDPKDKQLWMSADTATANHFANPWKHPEQHARVYKKYLAPLRKRGKPGIMLRSPDPSSLNPLTYSIISDPRVLVSPWKIAPKRLPNMAPLTAPALMDSMILRERD